MDNLDELVITTETPRARLFRIGIALFGLLLYGAMGGMICFSNPTHDTAIGVTVIAIGFIFFFIIMFVNKRGTWRLSASHIAFEPRNGRPIRFTWGEIAKVKWSYPIRVMGPGGEKIALPAPVSGIGPKDAQLAHKFVIEKLGDTFGYDDWRPKSRLVWSDPKTWFRWLGEMIALGIFLGLLPAIGLALIECDITDNEAILMLFMAGGVFLPVMILAPSKIIRMNRSYDRRR